MDVNKTPLGTLNSALNVHFFSGQREIWCTLSPECAKHALGLCSTIQIKCCVWCCMVALWMCQSGRCLRSTDFYQSDTAPPPRLLPQEVLKTVQAVFPIRGR